MCFCDRLKCGACGDLKDNSQKKKEGAVLRSVFRSNKLKKKKKKKKRTKIVLSKSIRAKEKNCFNGFYSADFKLSKSKNLIEH